MVFSSKHWFGSYAIKNKMQPCTRKGFSSALPFLDIKRSGASSVNSLLHDFSKWGFAMGVGFPPVTQFAHDIMSREVGASFKAEDIDYFWGLKSWVRHELFSGIEILKFLGCS